MMAQSLGKPANRWVERLFATIDLQDEEEFTSFLTEDATFRFGNAPEVIGREDARKAVADFFSSIGGPSHEMLGVCDLGETVICEFTVTYTRHDGEMLTLCRRPPSSQCRGSSLATTGSLPTSLRCMVDQAAASDFTGEAPYG
jgi:hypothetical protein